MDRTRLITAVVIAFGLVVFAAVTVGNLGGPVLLLVPVVGLAGYGVLRRQRSGGGHEVAWSGVGAAPASATLTTDGLSLAALTTPAAEPARGSVAVALGRVEAKHLAFNPWFAVGVGFWLILLAVFGVFWPEDAEWSWWEDFALLAAFAHPFVGCTIVAVHRGVSRARRDGAVELFSSCPAPEDARARGFLLTAWVPLLVSWVAAGAMVMLVATRGNAYGPIDGRALVDLVVMSILPVGGTMLGVALGRWAPWTIVPIVAVAAVAGLSALLSGLGPSSVESERALVSWLYSGDYDLVFLDPPVWERVAWLGGLTVAVGAIALLRGEHSRRIPVVLGAGLLVAFIGAGSLFRPLPDAQAEAMASLIGDPAAHQTCRAVTADVEVCAYDPYGEYADRAAEELAPVAAALPEGWTDRPVVFRHSFDGEVADLPEAVRDRLADGAPESDDEATLHLGYSSHPEAIDATRYRLASHAVGLPTEPVFPGTSVAGEARGVVALWLLTRGLPANAARNALTPTFEHSDDEVTAAMRGGIWPGLCHGEESAVVWSRQDLAAGRALLDLPDERVRDAVHEDWQRWLDPATSTDDLLAELGLDPVGPPDEIDPAETDSCY